MFRLVPPAGGEAEAGSGHESRALRALVRARLFTRTDPVRIGRFTVLERLGSGGMGVVWLAHDPDLDRRVAVKLLRPDVAGDDPLLAAERLRREAQAMAKLRHPNVVVVHEVGEHEGTVFLAMEYVAGTTMAQWLRARTRKWREIVTCFVAAGRGMEAAHAAGLIHRDFKPDNVLVGDDGRVCVTDFGLARSAAAALAGAATDLSGGNAETTASRSHDIAGTPVFMARECLTAGVVTAASDQFAFCVALYQALWGRHPFGEDPVDSVAGIVEGREPASPTNDRAPGRLWRLIRRGLSHDPAARHPSLRVLLDALADDPVARWRRRGLAAVVVVGLVAGAGFFARRDSACTDLDAPMHAAWNDTSRSNIAAAFSATALPYADEAWKRASAGIDAWSAGWVAQAEEACLATHERRTQSADLLDRRMACLDNGRRSLVALLEVLGTADAGVVEHVDDAVAALRDPLQCADLDTLARAVARPTDPELLMSIEELEVELAHAAALHVTGQYADARKSLDLLLPRAAATGYRPLEAEVAWYAGEARSDLGDRKAAFLAFDQTLVAAIAARDDAFAARAWLGMGWAWADDSGGIEAAAHASDLAAAAIEALGNTEEFQVDLWRLQGEIAKRRGDFATARDRALRALELVRTLEVDESRVASAELGVGIALYAIGDYETAIVHMRTAGEIFSRELGPEHPYTLRARSDLAGALTDLRRLPEAKAHHEAVLEARLRVLGPKHPEVGSTLVGLANVLYYQDDLEGALVMQRRAYETLSAAFGPEHVDALAALENQAAILSQLERYDEALEVGQRVLTQQEKIHGTEHSDLVGPLLRVARSLRGLGRAAEAVPVYARALTVAEHTLPKDHPRFMNLLHAQAECALAVGDREAARAGLERALEIGERAFGPDHVRMAPVLRALADLVPAERAAELVARAGRIEAANP